MTLDSIRTACPEATDEQAEALLQAFEAEMREAGETISRYRAEEEARREAREKQEARDALMRRMDAALDGRSFVHPRLREAVAEDFAQALADPGNAGRDDREVFDAVTEGQGLFASLHPEVPAMAGAGRTVSRRSAHLSAIRRAMGLSETDE